MQALCRTWQTCTNVIWADWIDKNPLYDLGEMWSYECVAEYPSAGTRTDKWQMHRGGSRFLRRCSQRLFRLLERFSSNRGLIKYIGGADVRKVVMKTTLPAASFSARERAVGDRGRERGRRRRAFRVWVADWQPAVRRLQRQQQSPGFASYMPLGTVVDRS